MSSSSVALSFVHTVCDGPVYCSQVIAESDANSWAEQVGLLRVFLQSIVLDLHFARGEHVKHFHFACLVLPFRDYLVTRRLQVYSPCHFVLEFAPSRVV